jgi:hypothetical protein
VSVVYTIGYEGTDIDRVVATLRTVGVTMLADVRAVAVSRKKGFSKNGLRERLEAEGNTYVHLVELGDPKLGRDAARGEAWRIQAHLFRAPQDRRCSRRTQVTRCDGAPKYCLLTMF